MYVGKFLSYVALPISMQELIFYLHPQLGNHGVCLRNTPRKGTNPVLTCIAKICQNMTLLTPQNAHFTIYHQLLYLPSLCCLSEKYGLD